VIVHGVGIVKKDNSKLLGGRSVDMKMKMHRSGTGAMLVAKNTLRIHFPLTTGRCFVLLNGRKRSKGFAEYGLIITTVEKAGVSNPV